VFFLLLIPGAFVLEDDLLVVVLVLLWTGICLTNFEQIPERLGRGIVFLVEGVAIACFVVFIVGLSLHLWGNGWLNWPVTPAKGEERA
jgi:hypothetical protein